MGHNKNEANPIECEYVSVKLHTTDGSVMGFHFNSNAPLKFIDDFCKEFEGQFVTDSTLYRIQYFEKNWKERINNNLL